jgi:hypothetical protein
MKYKIYKKNFAKPQKLIQGKNTKETLYVIDFDSPHNKPFLKMTTHTQYVAKCQNNDQKITKSLTSDRLMLFWYF